MKWRTSYKKYKRYSVNYLIFIIIGLVHFTNVNPINTSNKVVLNAIIKNENQSTILIKNDGNSTVDAGNNITNAMSINFGTYICTMPDGDSNDFYRIDIPIEAQITIEIAGESDTNFDLFLYNPFQTIIANSLNDYSIEYLSMYITDPGTYYIQILKISGSGIYYLATSSDIPETYTEPTTTENPDNTLVNWLVPTTLVTVLLIGILVGIIQVSKRAKEKKKVKIVYTKSEKTKFKEELQENDLQGYSFGYEKES